MIPGCKKTTFRNLPTTFPVILDKSPDDNIAQHIERCIEISIQMMDIGFDTYWNKVREYGKEDFDPENESLTRDCYLQGASSMLALLISAGMPPEFLDEVEEGGVKETIFVLMSIIE